MRILAGSRVASPGVRLLFEPRDMWIGLFANTADGYRLVYICLLPCLPIVLAWRAAA